jgi:probable rRNA maturation factor
MAKIKFFTEEIKYNLKHKTLIKTWIKTTIKQEGYNLKELNFIFCTDDYLLGINQTYLQHNDYTDVITFDNATKPKTILGDIFISIDRVKENASLFNTSTKNELCRVMIHGTLHLLGYKDKTKATKAVMTAKENEYLILKGFT